MLYFAVYNQLRAGDFALQHFVKLLGSQIIFREDSVLTIIHKGSVVLETERLILRRFTIDDLEPVFYNCWSKPEV